MTPGDLIDILGGKLPEATKQDLRLAAKRIHDRKRYAEKTQLNWTKDAAPSDTLDSNNVIGVEGVSETNRGNFLGKSR